MFVRFCCKYSLDDFVIELRSSYTQLALVEEVKEMKTLKAFPSALTTASYYLREASQKLASFDRLKLVTKLSAGVERLKRENSLSTPSSPTRSQFEVSRRAMTPDFGLDNRYETVTEADVDDEPMSLFESQMSDWAKSNQTDDSRINDISSLTVESKSSDSSSSNKPNAPQKLASSIMPRLSRSAINARTKQLISAIQRTTNSTSQTIRLQELSRHLMLYPDAVSLAVTDGAVPILFKVRDRAENSNVKAYSRQALNLLGHAGPPKGRGIRILSIDGGGTRGVVILEILRKIESDTGQPIYKLFDMICGVSTGAILTMLLGAMRTNIEQCEEYYRFVQILLQ